MNNHIRSLATMASRPYRHVIGLMSGTSLDGLDIVFCKITGAGLLSRVEVINFETIPYSETIKQNIRKVFAKKEVDFPYLAMLHAWIGLHHAELVNDFIAKHHIPKDQIDFVASHGQTVMHVPQHQHKEQGFPNATLQIGDGDHLAVHTGLITVSDFRQKHVAAGGEGAPLAVYGDYLLFSKAGEDRIMLNIGGIGNFTYLPGDGDASQVFVSDTGPGNTLMDAWMKTRRNMPYDKDAALASQGTVNQSLLEALKSNHFFVLDFPKSTGPEIFNLTYVESALAACGITDIDDKDMMATLNRLTAETIAEAITNVVGNKQVDIFVSGGGWHNILLINTLKELLSSCTITSCDQLGISGDAKEAVLFAVLANETIAGNPIDFGNNRHIPSICMGKISFPN